ncbi:3-deoxy-manno-octulosonate-8-phosphatase KdsC [Pseudidiomarina insulisalsae]|uniref:3-deoxy-D-manno-octulosonate 8-phosphate phosphatase KdsC n=1 Tax=Pseudidiomarina insulisalsae TaxID=575789 RepID=A0A432YN88_9GAMM|nr:3-deoxy-manno-octulosonate-8-phosphatase KdsC [Pseudidiomarina insulisalsae]RUO62451.1 3-deoxy-manno-octulosonate-8-phosphatase KdsC [Pseudidiomarina insulisalsae]
MPQATISTWYGDISESLFVSLQAIKLVIFDIDGVFSDGRIYLGNDGEELKAFHTRDGFGVKALLNSGVQVAVITGRQSHIVEQRMRALGVTEIYQGTTEKLAVYQKLASKYDLTDAAIASMGDDVPDVLMIQRAGIGVATQDAHPWVQQQADYITSMRGGFGAVRELSDLILLSQGHLQLQGGASV